MRPPDKFAHIFDDLAFDEARYARDLKRPVANTVYQIFFTPRSGSSWLTAVLHSTGAMGLPGETFNPKMAPKIAAKLNANSLERYVEMTRRFRTTAGVFGFEITYFQLRATFREEPVYVSHFPPSIPSVLLTRRDVIQQGVSLHKMVETKASHSVSANGDSLTEADRAYGYDAAAIRRWVEHIVRQEEGLSRFLKTHGYAPLALDYETMMAGGARHAAETIARHVGIDLPDDLNLDESHQKIGSAKNIEFAERFRTEETAFCKTVDKRRAKLWK